MDLYRINLKFFLESWTASHQDIFRIFNTWISTTSDEVLVDVADYSHVHAGPVILLVGHEANYCIDNTDEKMGLLYARKLPLDGSLSDRFHSVFAAALKACRRLEQESELEGKVKFRGDEAILVANDRLQAPNTEETLSALRTDLDAVLKELYGGAEFAVDPVLDAGQRLTLRIKSTASFDIASLLENLN